MKLSPCSQGTLPNPDMSTLGIQAGCLRAWRQFHFSLFAFKSLISLGNCFNLALVNYNVTNYNPNNESRNEVRLVSRLFLINGENCKTWNVFRQSVERWVNASNFSGSSFTRRPLPLHKMQSIQSHDILTAVQQICWKSRLRFWIPVKMHLITGFQFQSVLSKNWTN